MGPVQPYSSKLFTRVLKRLIKLEDLLKFLVALALKPNILYDLDTMIMISERKFFIKVYVC